MRTTLDIDDDEPQGAKERARHENKTAGTVVSELPRQALTAASCTHGRSVRSSNDYGLQ